MGKGRDILHLDDPERIAIKSRLGKTVRYLGEHTITRDFLLRMYGTDNPLLGTDPQTEVTLLEAASLAVYNRALKGDVKALEFIRDTMGEKPATSITVSSEGATTLSSMTASELESLLSVAAGKPVIDVSPEEESGESPAAPIESPFGGDGEGEKNG